MPIVLDVGTMQGSNIGTALTPTPLFLGAIGLTVGSAANLRVGLTGTVSVTTPVIAVANAITVQIRRSSIANLTNFAATQLVTTQTLSLPAGFLNQTLPITIAGADFNPTPIDPGRLVYSLWVFSASAVGGLTTGGIQTLWGVAAGD